MEKVVCVQDLNDASSYNTKNLNTLIHLNNLIKYLNKLNDKLNDYAHVSYSRIATHFTSNDNEIINVILISVDLNNYVRINHNQANRNFVKRCNKMYDKAINRVNSYLNDWN